MFRVYLKSKHGLCKFIRKAGLFGKKNMTFYINCHAISMAVVQPLDSEIDFARKPISGSAVWSFVIILKFIFTALKNLVACYFFSEISIFSRLKFLNLVILSGE